MHIQASNVQLTSQYQYQASHSKFEKLRYWNTNIPQFNETATELKGDILELTAQAKERAAATAQDETVCQISDKDKQKILLIREFIRALTGKEIDIKIPEKISVQNGKTEISLENGQPAAANGATSQGWGLDYYYQEIYSESEKLSFSAQGVFKTADGKDVQFDLDLNLSRSFVEQNQVSLKAGDALIDPLIINYAGSAAELTDTKFSFDLDSNGQEEIISTIAEGSGFLALDQNGDGVVNNGTELFGAATGNGFAELAAYDEDQNGWIDETDSVFNNLRIWSKNAAGEDELVVLSQKGIGAIYLGNVAAQFNYVNDDQELNGLSRKAGIFAREDGTVGSIQQVDFVV